MATTEPLAPPSSAQAVHLWIDPSAGVAGDMLLGALIDAGADEDAVQRAVDRVIPGTVQIQVHDVRRAGQRATKADVEKVAADLPHRHWSEIRAMIEAADLEASVAARALAVFERLARAEARAHGVEPEAVHFHEVGAWDSIADVVGVCAALADLGVTSVSAGAVALGHGTVTTAHGRLPVPVPAVLELARGWRVLPGGEGEQATPTGMALVTALAERCEAIPAMTVAAVGVGAGTRDVPGQPNVVRVVLGTPESAPGVSGREEDDGADVGSAVVIEANVDDLDPRVWPGVLTALLEAGAADAWLTPVLMKKGRPAHVLSLLAAPEQAPALRSRIFRLVPTLGIREIAVRKTALDRAWHEVVLDGERVRIKTGHRAGLIVTATPEFEDVAHLAAARGEEVRVVLARAVAAAEAAGLGPGAPAPSTGG